MHVPNLEYTSDYGKISFTDEINATCNRFPSNSYGTIFPWDQLMADLKTKIETHTNSKFGMCVCIYYPDGNTGVDYHSDFRAFGELDLIPSISLGAGRTFLLRNKSTRNEHEILLDPGSMLIMGEHCQERYEHCLPLDPSCLDPHINLTFRKVESLY